MSNDQYHKAYKRQYLKFNKALSVTIPMDSYKSLERRAMAWNMKPTTLFRELALSQLEGVSFIPDTIEEELKALRFLILNIANNVNQMAHHSNMLKGMVDERGLLNELRNLEKTISDHTKQRLRETPLDH